MDNTSFLIGLLQDQWVSGPRPYICAIALLVFATGCQSTVAPQILYIDGPTELGPDTSATFVAQINDQATEPVRLAWDFGDGTTDVGLRAVHQFQSSGAYVVRFTAENEAGRATQSVDVRVRGSTDAPRIATLRVDPNPATVATPVTYTASIRGAVTAYTWDFGDGTETSDATPTHQYAEPGRYPVDLRIVNEAGDDTRTVWLEVLPDVPGMCKSYLETNTVLFAPNTSTLSDRARNAVQENVALFELCAPLPIHIEGYAASYERRAAVLSQDRAEAVAARYRAAGISADRIRITSYVVSPKNGQPKSQKAGTHSLRRATSTLKTE